VNHFTILRLVNFGLNIAACTAFGEGKPVVTVMAG
jgi:hypothetical protein